MTFCKYCGCQLEDGAMFCVACGQSQADAAPQQAAPQAPVYAQPQQPVYGAPQVPYGNPYAKPSVPGKGLGIASMVLGIVSLVLFCYWFIAIPCGIVAAALGGIALSKAKEVGMKNGLATAGLVCSCIALGIAILFVIFVAAGLAELGLLV